MIRIYFWTEDAQMDTALIYLHADHLNTPRTGTNSNGTIVWQWNSDAFGSLLPNEDPDSNGTPTTVNLRFPGQYFDKETNLHYNYFRDYDPRIGRYLESDPIGLAGGLNTFGYVGQNPLKLTDSMGLFWGENYFNYSSGVIKGTGDFVRNYRDMRKANTINSDKYFHCKANCQATQRGKGGKDAAECISDAREWFDQNIKNDRASESVADQAANLYGRTQGEADQGGNCRLICAPFRPSALPMKY